MDEALSRELGRLVDRQEIMECLNRYARGLDRRDPALLRSAYHPDATDHHGVLGDYDVDGLIRDWLVRDRGRVFSQHLIINTSIDLTDDEAHVETYFQVIVELRSGVRPDEPRLTVNGGRYVDHFEKRLGHWGIARRVVVVEYKASLDGMSGHPGLLMWAHRSTKDPSYARPLLGPPE